MFIMDDLEPILKNIKNISVKILNNDTVVIDTPCNVLIWKLLIINKIKKHKILNKHIIDTYIFLIQNINDHHKFYINSMNELINCPFQLTELDNLLFL
ncbi:MAG: hypothetical protein [Cotesia congregata filamentous virus 2]